MRAFISSKITIVLATILLVVGILSISGNEPSRADTHDVRMIRGVWLSMIHRGGNHPLPMDTNPLFSASGQCGGCHGPDFQGLASVDNNGTDINVTSDWRSTMMANAAKDPFWRAKVSHEVLVNPGLQVEIESTCTRCHAPTGNHTAALSGNPHYSIAQMEQSALALDGVTCVVCHLMTNDSLGILVNGNIKLDTANKTIFGPYVNPFAPPMNSFVGYNVDYGEQINDAALCAGCHTLITETVDFSGNLTGDKFYEQVTYNEWVNSDYNLTNVTCQECHIPRVTDSVQISVDYPFIDKRSPFGKHYFVGGNSFMLKLMRANIDQLGITADTSHFDSTIARTLDLLQQQSLDLSLTETNRTADTAFYTVRLENKAGHKFPSGYPSRRMYVEFVVTDENMDTLFKSGIVDGNFEVEGQDPQYEVHYDMINQTDQVQIYELVMGDVNDDVTTVLERAKSPLKDNRIPPAGFTTTHYTYDTTLIAGLALTDADFNLNGITEGTGADVVHYHVPMNSYTGVLNVSARVYYQSLPPKWMEEMFSMNSAEIDTFRNMFNAADRNPVLVGEQYLGNLFVNVDEEDLEPITIYPNPVTGGLVWLKNPSNQRITNINVYHVNGQLVQTISKQTDQIQLPDQPGMYVIEIETKKNRFIEKVIRL
jgi:cytochrome c553